MDLVRRALVCLTLLASVMAAATAISGPAGAAGTNTFKPVTPVRLLDTRTGNGAAQAKVGPGQTITVQITGRGGIPASGVGAVSVNLTATGPTAASYLVAWPAGQARPTASTLNFRTGATIANSTVVGLSASGMLSIYNRNGYTNVIADISGWFPTNSDFTPITPVRLLDTRTGNGASAVKVGAGQSVSLLIAGRGGIPTGATAVSVNFTATGATESSYLTAWPAGQTRPTASTLNFPAGQTIANATVITLSSNGRISIFNKSGSTDIIADVTGWFSTTDTFFGMLPVRLLDTRNGNGAAAAKVGPGQSITVQITGRGGIPKAGIGAVSINLTTTGSSESSYLTAWPTGQSRPTASTLNFSAGQTIANSTIVGLSASGRITIFNRSGSTNVIADITGWFSTDTPAYSQITAGDQHTCATGSKGRSMCWGANGFGQLGTGNTTMATFPVAQPNLTGVLQVAAGYQHTCALINTGRVKCWGNNALAVVGDGTSGNTRLSPVVVSGISNAVRVAAGREHSCALLGDGTVKCWGSNGSGQLGPDAGANSNTPIVVGGIADAVDIAAGRYHSCAVLSSGAVRCWGYNAYGQLGNNSVTDSANPVVVSGVSTASQVSAASSRTCVVLRDGTARCWGLNGMGELGDGTTNDRHTPVAVSGLSGTARIANGEDHTCAVLTSGVARCWGSDSQGQLGNGTGITSVPVTVTGISGGTDIAGGSSHTCATLTTGGARCWGFNGSGQLGNSGTVNSSTPVPVAFP